MNEHEAYAAVYGTDFLGSVPHYKKQMVDSQIKNVRVIGVKLDGKAVELKSGPDGWTAPR